VRAIGTQRRGLPTLPATVAPDAPADE
jgi:hypothetical protein